MATLAADARPRSPIFRSLVIGLIGFLTLADLFATQAILPPLARHYGVAPGAIGIAANAGTIGMALAGLLAGVLIGDIDRRRGIWVSLALLAIPTLLLSIAPNLLTFALLRIVQGLCMATAFTLMITYLSEQCRTDEIASSLSAYVTGVVASNLVGRLIAATVTDLAGTSASFLVFAAMNLIGAAVTYTALSAGAPLMRMHAPGRFWAAWATHLADARLRRAYAIGFLILFAFIGVFTYVGFVLAAPPLSVSMQAIGFVFLCFAPSMVTTPLAGGVASRYGAQRVLPLALVLAIAGLGLVALSGLAAIVAGLVLFAVGTFFAQAIATGFVGRAATTEKAAASGLYLFFYYAGGLVGAAAIGQLFDRAGWNAAIIACGAALALAAAIGLGLIIPAAKEPA